MVPEGLTLRGYQSAAAAFLAARPRVILGDAPGVGKTITALVSLASRNIERILVVAPLSVVHRWEDEAALWVPDYAIHVSTGSAARRHKVVTAATHSTGPTILVTNYEAAKRDVELLRALTPAALVIDEAHRVKERRTKNFAAIKALSEEIPIFISVTGTPILNRPEELWALLHLIDPKRWRSYWAWVDEFCEADVVQHPGMTQPTKVVKGMRLGMDAVLRQQLRDVMIRRTLEELLPNLPKVTETTVTIDLSSHERKLYDQMRLFYFAESHDPGAGMAVIARNEVSKITRLRQLAQDWSMLSIDAPDDARSSKLDALREIVDDLDPEPVVIFSCFAKVIDRVARMLGCPKITGAVGPRDRRDVIRAFQAGTVRAIAGTVGTMAEGIDLFRAHHVVFTDLDWVPARNDQAVARVLRSGQQSDKVFVHRIVARNTVDQFIERKIRQKEAVINALVGSAWQEVVGT